jgi:hypothetical protein
MLAAFLSLFYYTSAAARTSPEAAAPAAFRECVNATLPGWSAVKVDYLPARLRRPARDGEDARAATVFFDSAGRVRATTKGQAAFERGEVVVIAGIFPWGLRVSSSMKHEVEPEPGAIEEGHPAFYLDADLAFDSFECPVVARAWAELFDPVEAEEAQRLLAGSAVLPTGIQSSSDHRERAGEAPAEGHW